MPIPYGLFTDSEIDRNMFHSILQSVGGVATDDATSADIAAGRLSQGQNHVWVFLKKSPLEELEMDEIDAIRRALGAPPGTKIILDVSREPNSGRLAVDLARAFGQAGKCIVYDFNSKFMSLDEFKFDMNRQ